MSWVRSGWKGVKRGWLFPAFFNTESKGQQVKLMLDEAESKRNPPPWVSLTKETVDAGSGQMLGREAHCGLPNRQQQVQEIYLVKNRLNIKGECHTWFFCHYYLAMCSQPGLETEWLSAWTFALNQTCHFYIPKCEISLQCVILRKPFVTKLHIHFLWNAINFPIISFFNAGHFNLP